MFTNIETSFSSDGGNLKCAASGDPTPVLHWIEPLDKIKEYEQFRQSMVSDTHESSSSASVSLNTAEAILYIKKEWTNDVTKDPQNAPESNVILNDAERGEEIFASRKESDSEIKSFKTYICFAQNRAGNVSLTINVSWPQSQRSSPNSLFLPTKRTMSSSTVTTVSSSVSIKEPEQLIHKCNSSSASDLPRFDLNNDPIRTGDGKLTVTEIKNNYSSFSVSDVTNPVRLFTLAELVGAVVTSHVCTLLLCLATVLVCCQRRRHKRKMDQLKVVTQSQTCHHYAERVDELSKVWKADNRWSYRASSLVDLHIAPASTNTNHFYVRDYFISSTLPQQTPR